jgi:hypothetical protein
VRAYRHLGECGPDRVCAKMRVQADALLAHLTRKGGGAYQSNWQNSLQQRSKTRLKKDKGKKKRRKGRSGSGPGAFAGSDKNQARTDVRVNERNGESKKETVGKEGRGGGRKRNVPFGQVLHASSFTRRTVVSGSNVIALRRPVTSKNCKSVCGTCGTVTTASTPSGCSSASAGGSARAVPPPPPPSPSSLQTGTVSSRTSSSPAMLPGLVVLSTRVNEVRVLAGSTAISTGRDLVNVGREALRCGGVG